MTTFLATYFELLHEAPRGPLDAFFKTSPSVLAYITEDLLGPPTGHDITQVSLSVEIGIEGAVGIHLA